MSDKPIIDKQDGPCMGDGCITFGVHGRSDCVTVDMETAHHAWLDSIAPGKPSRPLTDRRQRLAHLRAKFCVHPDAELNELIKLERMDATGSGIGS